MSEPKPSYWSFLVCSHADGALVNLYFNGLPIGCVRGGAFELHARSDGRPVSAAQMPPPRPFDTFAEMADALRDIIGKIQDAPKLAPNQPEGKQ